VSTDDRILRLENAMATLAELSANHEQRVARLEEAFARLGESFVTRVPQLEEAFATPVKPITSHEERIDGASEGIDELRAAQAESEHKIAALADIVKTILNERQGGRELAN
jgi:chromosome segregation ATPase